jgi:flavin reductase (DIM6/NTAB) family NADH-FMN oxidoreductase RutF
MMPAATLPQSGEHVFVPEPGNARTFRHALGTFTTGVAVVTVMSPSGPVGITVNSFASVSLDPPLVLWSLAKSSTRHALFTGTQHYVIHVLEAGQDGLSARFSRGGAGFENLDWAANADGAPYIGGTLSRFECALSTLHDGGDHTIVIGQVLRAAHREGEPLCFSRGYFGRFTLSA